MALHRDLTGADLHEPKGITTATQDTTYIANGAGSGVWKKPTLNEIDITNIFGVKQFGERLHIGNINQNKTFYFVGGEGDVVGGKLYAVRGVVDGTVTDGTTLRFLKNGSVGLGATYTFPNGTNPGFVFSFGVAPAVQILPGDTISIQSTGSGSVVTALNLHLLYAYF